MNLKKFIVFGGIPNWTHHTAYVSTTEHVTALPWELIRQSVPTSPEQLSFQIDKTRDEKVIKLLTVTDEYSREYPTSLIDSSIMSKD